jgi:hypothetical protein
MSEMFNGSRTSMVFGTVSVFLLAVTAGVFILGLPIFAVFSLLLSAVFGVISYVLAGGAANPEIYADMDLYSLVRYAVRSGNARVGFPKFKNQDTVLAMLQAAGISVSPRGDRRRRLRTILIANPLAFAACLDVMFIECMHGEHEYLWDGRFHPKTSGWFIDAEILINFRDSPRFLVDRLIQLEIAEREMERRAILQE